MKGVEYSYSRRRKVAQPSSLGEYLWSWALDDFVSEEDDKEFAKIIGQRNTTTLASLLCSSTNGAPAIGEYYEDPRSVRIRGGRNSPTEDSSRRDGTPAVWADTDTHSAPMIWLSVPSEAVDDASELSDHIPPGGATGASRMRVQTRNPKLSMSKSRDFKSQGSGSRSRSLTNSRGESKVGSRASSKGISNRSPRGVLPQNGSKSVGSRRSHIHQGNKQRSRSITRSRPEHRQPGNDRYNDRISSRGNRGRSASRGRSEKRQPSHDKYNDHTSRGRSPGRKRSTTRGRSASKGRSEGRKGVTTSRMYDTESYRSANRRQKSISRGYNRQEQRSLKSSSRSIKSSGRRRRSVSRETAKQNRHRKY